ncbi:hypothetical protein KC343_g8005, partial [Hortaea werneckii]
GRLPRQRLAVLYRRLRDVGEHYLWGGESGLFLNNDKGDDGGDDEFSVVE